MFSSISIASVIAFTSVVSAAPFTFPIASNGFPNIANPSAQLTAIEQAAQGSLPNGGPPPTITRDSLTSLQLIAFNELSEVAFFTELLANVTNNVDGYQFKKENGGERDRVIKALTAVVAQEELHLLNANGAIAHFGPTFNPKVAPIQPCKYNFPVSNFKDAVGLASTFTDVVLGTLQDVQSLFGADGDVKLIRGVGSVIGQEGEQNGFYRTILGKIPSALPFLTTSTRDFAFSALQGFTVPGSCPDVEAKTIPLKIFSPLSVDTKTIDAKQQNLQFSVKVTPAIINASTVSPAAVTSKWGSQYEQLRLVYINQQNTPVVEQIQNVKLTAIDSGSLTLSFEALFPFNGTSFGNGLTIAAITSGPVTFADADAVASSTIFGPGLIEVN